MTEILRVAEQVGVQAERDEAEAFNRQYELSRGAERAVAALAEQGAARARQWAEDDRRDEADRRFDPEPDDPPRAEPAASRLPEVAGDGDEDGDEDGAEDGVADDRPTLWLR